MSSWRRLSVLAIATSVACGGSAADQPVEAPGAKSSAATGVGTAAEPAARSGPRGLDDPRNNPEVVALAKGLLTCNWKVGTGYSDECPPGKAWYESKLLD